MSARSNHLLPGSPSSVHGSVITCRRGTLGAWLVALAFVSALLSGCSGSNREEEPEDADAEARTGTDSDSDDTGTDGLDDAMTRKLTDQEVRNYMGAIKALKELGALTDQQMGDNPSELQKFATAFSLPGKWESTLKKHGFDSESYAEVQMAVIGALGALMSEDVKAQIEKEREQQEKQMEELKKVMSPEDFAAMEKGMKEAQKGMLSLYEGVPKENIALARKYREQLEAVFK